MWLHGIIFVRVSHLDEQIWYLVDGASHEFSFPNDAYDTIDTTCQFPFFRWVLAFLFSGNSEMCLEQVIWYTDSAWLFCLALTHDISQCAIREKLSSRLDTGSVWSLIFLPVGYRGRISEWGILTRNIHLSAHIATDFCVNASRSLDTV